jgi:micrococcal nuclease
MATGHRLKKAPQVGAFFISLVWASAAFTHSCEPQGAVHPVQVRYVHDGDSVVLDDNRRIRLIGVNAPEIAHEDRPTEALAIEARDHLRRLLLKAGNRAKLVYGEQRKDRHGRHLAHLWLLDGSNLAAELLREGLGWAVAVPPNVRYIDCYAEAEGKAHSASRGVWEHADHEAKESQDLSPRDDGFQRVRGRVTRINQGGGATWINLNGRFALRIPDQDIGWFTAPPDGSWLGRYLEVRGWVYRRKGELRMTVPHPAAIDFLD